LYAGVCALPREESEQQRYGRSWGQPASALDAADVQKGHDLAIHICAICHVAAPDQPYQPIMKAFGTVICLDRPTKNF